MKKVFGMILAVVAFALASCGGAGGADQSTPKGVAEAAYKAMQAQDFDAYVNLMCFKDMSKADETRKSMKGMLEMSKNDKGSQVKSFEILSEDITSDDTAIVKVKVVDGDDKEKESGVTCKKVDGKWWIDSGK